MAIFVFGGSGFAGHDFVLNPAIKAGEPLLGLNKLTREGDSETLRSKIQSEVSA